MQLGMQCNSLQHTSEIATLTSSFLEHYTAVFVHFVPWVNCVSHPVSCTASIALYTPPIFPFSTLWSPLLMCSLFAAELPKTPVGRRGTKFTDSKMITYCTRCVDSGLVKQGWHKGLNVGFVPLATCSFRQRLLDFTEGGLGLF